MAESDDYRRGHEAGGIAERLDSHDEHFRKINGSIEKSADALYQLSREVHDLKVIVQARESADAAFSNADQHRRTVNERSWSLAARLTIAAGVVVLAVVVLLLLVNP